MNQINVLLKEAAQLGFEIVDNNKEVIATNEKAKSYYQKYYTERNYVLGNVPAESEQLNLVEYDAAFGIVEQKHKQLSKEEYEELHKLAEKNSLSDFINDLESRIANLKSEKYSVDEFKSIEGKIETFEDMIDEAKDWQHKMNAELNEIIYDLKKAI